MMMVRKLTASDLNDVKDVFFHSFSEDEARMNFPVISQIITETTNPSSLCLGYEIDGKVVSAVAFSPVFFTSQTSITAYILAPLATHELHQKKGIATQLIAAAKDYLTESAVDALLVYGDPQYYGRYGFNADLGKHFIPPYPLEYEFGWQAMMLSNRDVSNVKLDFACVSALSDAALW